MFNAIPTLAALSDAHPQAVSTFSAALSGDRLHHAYLLMCNQAGASNQLAIAVGQLLVCQNPVKSALAPAACQTCPGCKKFAGGNHPDVLIIQPNEKKVIPIAEIRQLSSRLNLRAAESNTKVVLFLEADHMNPAAQNALLKTLEEPPGKTCFLLTGRRFRQFLPTIRSRVQRIQLAPPALPKTRALLEEGGVPPRLSASLAALVGFDTEQADRHIEHGAEEVLNQLLELLAEPRTSHLLELASDWASTKERAAIALELIEVFTRDGLARRWGARDDQLHWNSQSIPPQVQFDAAAAQLQELRKNRTKNPNKTMSIESVLLHLTEEIETRSRKPPHR